MRSIVFIFLAFVAMATALAIDPLIEDIKRELEEVPDDTEFALKTISLEDGRTQYEFLIDGEVTGKVILAEEDDEDDKFEFYDAEGNLVDPEANDEDDQAVQKRGWKWKIVKKLYKILKKYGKKAFKFFKCVGWSKHVFECLGEYLACYTSGIAPALCATGHYCIGKRAYTCAKKHPAQAHGN
ncbi:unnamed protein product [Clonostachys rosea]|uniref:Uncharacterized protein n=1 Tax=Bionectria ochroleuca TaxID=29856 RepID=A0ABY6U5G7_BIOOC|nr:unnamed protein product [Clonostachys rosea]